MTSGATSSDAATENIYTAFQVIAGDELNGLVSRIRASAILTYSRWIDPLLKRALPDQYLSGFSGRFYLDNLPPSTDPGKVVCLCLDSTWNIHEACRALSTTPAYDKTLIIFPRVTTLCRAAVDKHHLDKLNLIELHLDLLPLESWAFLVPSPRCFARCFIDHDLTDVYTIARSLCKLEIVLGAPLRVFTVGAIAESVYDLLEQQKAQIGESNRNPDSTFFDLFIIDRTADLVTPLLTQMTYGGLVDDKFDVSFGYMDLPEDYPPNELLPAGRRLLLSDDADEVFSKARGLPVFDALDHILGLIQEIKDIKVKLSQTTGTTAWNANGLRAARLNKMKPYMEVHLELLQRVFPPKWLERLALDFEYSLLVGNEVEPELIRRLINCGRPADGMRLLCLYSQLTKGVDSKLYGDVLRRLIGAVGISIVRDIANFDKCGLLRLQTGLFASLRAKSKFEPAREQFKCVLTSLERKVDSDGNDAGPADVGAAYDKYVPLVVRIVQAGIQGKWGTSEVEGAFKKLELPHKLHAPPELPNPPFKKVLVFIIGGVTESENGIFHQLGSVLFRDEVEFHIGSTAITSGRKLIAEIAPVFRRTK